ncbi:MAG TPA: DUF72 domain-containing protein [Chthoniobacteraceae bacterium]|jgi:uncharacterized protein YecE (DUF72 family)
MNDDNHSATPAPDDQALIGTAGWSLPKAEHGHFPGTGSHLERYAAVFHAVEINSSFHRSHKRAIWARWRDAVPDRFRFSVKMPKTITHTARLEGAEALVATFLEEASNLGSKLACILVQLPPSLGFDPDVAARFFRQLRDRTSVAVACEPRHASWFAEEANALLASAGIARVAADPARVPGAAEPGGSRSFSYFRLHGSPRIYYSAYSDEFVAQLARRVAAEQRENRTAWCIFDNTTLGAATRNALDLADAGAASR